MMPPPDLVALLAALDNFTGFVAAKRKRLVGKRGPKTQRHLVEQIIEIIEEYLGAKVKRSGKRGTPADVVRKIVDAVRPYAFDRVYAGWWDRVMPSGGIEAVERSARRYLRWIGADEPGTAG